MLSIIWRIARNPYVWGVSWSQRYPYILDSVAVLAPFAENASINVVVFGEAHLRRILKGYASYCDEVRTHLSLNKGTPYSRRAQRIRNVASLPVLGGLHHHYVRI
jgi:hypothetical protein